MKGLLLRWLVLCVAIMVAAYLFPGIRVTRMYDVKLFDGALVLGFLNAFFRPILILLTLPINVLTLGLFTFVINAFLLMMTSGVTGGLVVDGFGSALLGSLIISVVSWLLSSFINDQGQVQSVKIAPMPSASAAPASMPKRGKTASCVATATTTGSSDDRSGRQVLHGLPARRPACDPGRDHGLPAAAAGVANY